MQGADMYVSMYSSNSVNCMNCNFVLHSVFGYDLAIVQEHFSENTYQAR
jgi:hypothetical protein